MLLLSNTTSTLSLVTGSAGAIAVHVDYVDVTVATQVVAADVGVNSPSIVTATTSVLIGSGSVMTGAPGSPAAGVSRNVGTITIRNTHASVANLITVNTSDGTNSSALFAATLQPGEMAQLDTFGDWKVLDVNGSLKTTYVVPGLTIQTVTTGTSATVTAVNTEVRWTSTTAGAKTTTLPTATGSGKIVVVTDAGSLAANPANNITVSGGTINGSTVLNIAGMSLTFLDVGSGLWDSI